MEQNADRMYNRRADGYALSKQRRERKSMQKKPRAGILFLTIMMLWGIIYPQYAFTEEMYETVQSADAADGSDRTAAAAGRDCLRDYRRILTAAPGEVSVRFAIVDQIEAWFGEKIEK